MYGFANGTILATGSHMTTTTKAKCKAVTVAVAVAD